MTEFDFIREHLAPLAGPEGLGLMDDAALLTPPAGHELVLTKDTLVEGVHFPLGMYGADVAERLLRTNLSDLAAKGAMPMGYMLSLAIPPMVRRSGASAGEDVWVSGHIGEGFLGLKHVLSKRIDPPPTGEALWRWEEAYLRPEPRLKLSGLLRKVATAAADVSDGLVADAAHIAEASGVSMTLKLPAIPLTTGAFIWADGQADRLKAKVELITAGDDYEIVFTALAEHRALIEHGAAELGVPLTRIGYVGDGRGVSVLGFADEIIDINSTGYKHF